MTSTPAASINPATAWTRGQILLAGLACLAGIGGAVQTGYNAATPPFTDLPNGEQREEEFVNLTADGTATLGVVIGILVKAYSYYEAAGGGDPVGSDTQEPEAGPLASPILPVLALVEGAALLTGFGEPYRGEVLEVQPVLAAASNHLQDSHPDTNWTGSAADAYSQRVLKLDSIVDDLAYLDQQFADLLEECAQWVIHLRLALGILKALLVLGWWLSYVLKFSGMSIYGFSLEGWIAAAGTVALGGILFGFGVCIENTPDYTPDQAQDLNSHRSLHWAGSLVSKAALIRDAYATVGPLPTMTAGPTVGGPASALVAAPTNIGLAAITDRFAAGHTSAKQPETNTAPSRSRQNFVDSLSVVSAHTPDATLPTVTPTRPIFAEPTPARVPNLASPAAALQGQTPSKYHVDQDSASAAPPADLAQQDQGASERVPVAAGAAPTGRAAPPAATGSRLSPLTNQNRSATPWQI